MMMIHLYCGYVKLFKDRNPYLLADFVFCLSYYGKNSNTTIVIINSQDLPNAYFVPVF